MSDAFCTMIALDADGRRFAIVSKHPRSIYLSLAGPLSATGLSLTAGQALRIAEALLHAVDCAIRSSDAGQPAGRA